MRATSLRWAGLTLVCLGALTGCAGARSGSVTPSGGSPTAQAKAKTPAAAPATASDKSTDPIPFAGDGARNKVADTEFNPGDKGTDLGFDIPNLEVLDPEGLKGSLAILRIGSEVKETKLLSVFTGMKNKTGQKLSLEVQTIYKDRAGNPLNDGTWVPMTLKPHEETEYRSASLSVDAVDFTVRIRRAVPPNG